MRLMWLQTVIKQPFVSSELSVLQLLWILMYMQGQVKMISSKHSDSSGNMSLITKIHRNIKKNQIILLKSQLCILGIHSPLQPTNQEKWGFSIIHFLIVDTNSSYFGLPNWGQNYFNARTFFKSVNSLEDPDGYIQNLLVYCIGVIAS